ncbi:Myb-like DNA-binding protein [Nitzschia inconspicua]|uniref:Myb-like DNA-binding protein n=1 Tax=Nitzschia inconspicua TaxID=303405 RepID=A0A9K3LNI8_9STRA|nr:Myb-like DNA-binding protein [Nitzschia inconspicua]
MSGEDSSSNNGDIVIEAADELSSQQDHYQDPGNIYYALTPDAAPGEQLHDTNKWKKTSFGNEKLRTGKFTKEESDIIRQAVEEYCSVRNISVARLCSECDHRPELKGAWTQIAKSLPHRSVQSVYRHGLRQLHPFKRGAWSLEERELLLDMVTRIGKKWSVISAKINRSADSCRDKYREMDETFVKGRWKDEETERFKKLIREHLQADPDADIKELGKMVEQEGIKIAWSVISKCMVNRSRLSCFKKWQKMTGIYSPSDQDFAPVADHHDYHKMVSIKDEKNEPALAAATTASAAAIAAGIVNSESDLDVILLSDLAESNVSRSSEVDWDSLRVENAQERWQMIIEEFQSNTTDDSVLAMALSEIAQHILDQKTSAQRAAETVEAVDLPAPESLHHREG